MRPASRSRHDHEGGARCDWLVGLADDELLEVARFLPDLSTCHLSLVNRTSRRVLGTRAAAAAELRQPPFSMSAEALDSPTFRLSGKDALLPSDAVRLAELLAQGAASTAQTVDLSDLPLHFAMGGICSAVREGALASVRELVLPNVGLSDEACARLASATHGLIRLDVSDNALDAVGLAAACRGGALASLRSLNLVSNRVRDDGMHALAGCVGAGGLAMLDRLELAHNLFGPRGTEALAAALIPVASHPIANPSHLVLGDWRGGNELGDEGLLAVLDACRAGALSAAVDLDLQSHHATDVAVSAFAHALLETPELLAQLEHVEFCASAAIPGCLAGQPGRPLLRHPINDRKDGSDDYKLVFSDHHTMIDDDFDLNGVDSESDEDA